MSRLADKARFKESVSKLIAQFAAPARERSFAGAEPGPTLEHVTRRHFIDPFLRALGWDLSRLNEEMIEEARTRGETTLRLDFLGVNPQTRVPVLIVEAKAWAVPFIAPSAREGSAEGSEASRPISLICAAIEHCKGGGVPKDSPVTQEWADYLAKLHQYVTTVHVESGHVVTRVATVSGQWLVTFIDPQAIFLTPGKVNPLLIGIYRESELVTRADEIFDQLARGSVNDAFPAIVRPTLLPAFITASDVKRAYHALWVSRQVTGASWKPRPNLDFYVAMVLERRDGALLTVIDESLQVQSLPHDYNAMGSHIAAVEAQADELLRRVNVELGATLSPVALAEFPGFPASTGAANQVVAIPSNQPRVDLIKMTASPGEFILVTGSTKHFLLQAPTVNPCACHDWVYCQSQDQGQGQQPVFGRSVDPKAFFTSREPHHCAHRLVHDRRNTRCQVDAFEEFLCCRACHLQNFCWGEGDLVALPCGAAAPVP